MRMAKTIQDLVACMPTELNREDEISLGYFRTALGLNHITNNPNNIKKDFEKHDQFVLDVGKEIIVNAFNTFLANSSKSFSKDLAGATDMLLTFLSECDIKYYYDPNNFNEKQPFDDALSSCRSIASRTLLALIADTVVHESDGLGCRAIRTVMILYFLNKKLAQTSKYAAGLLSNKVYYMGASEKTKYRIDALACCNPKGGDGNGLDRDMVNEHKVRSAKDVFKGLHSQLTDMNVTKGIQGDNVINLIKTQDNESMLFKPPVSSTQRYLSDEQRQRVRMDLDRIQPFCYDREKIEYFDKVPGSPFHDLTEDRILWFLERNKKNFKKNFPHKNLL